MCTSNSSNASTRFHHVLFLCKIPCLWRVLEYARASNLVIHNGTSPWEFQAHACYHENRRAPFQETINIIWVWVSTLLQKLHKLRALISLNKVAAYWFGGYRVEFSGQRPAILTDVVYSFPQSLHQVFNSYSLCPSLSITIPQIKLFRSLSSGVWRCAVWLTYQRFGGTWCFHL